MFALNWRQLDIGIAQNVKALVQQLDDIHRCNDYIFIVLLVIPLRLQTLQNIVRK